MVGLKRFEMVVELIEEVFVLCWHLWVVSLDDMYYWHCDLAMVVSQAYEV